MTISFARKFLKNKPKKGIQFEPPLQNPLSRGSVRCSFGKASENPDFGGRNFVTKITKRERG